MKQWNHKFLKSHSNLHAHSSYCDYTDWFPCQKNPWPGGKSNLSTHIYSTDGDYPWWYTIWTLIFICQQLHSVLIPYDPLNTCLHLASSAPSLFPVPVFWALVSSPCLTVSHPSSLSSDALSPTAKRKRKYYSQRCLVFLLGQILYITFTECTHNKNTNTHSVESTKKDESTKYFTKI